MTRLDSIEATIRALSPDELAEFRRWFADVEAAAWDQEFERDVKQGKLDPLAVEALRDHAAGKTSDLRGISPRVQSGPFTANSGPRSDRWPTRPSNSSCPSSVIRRSA